MCYLKKFLLDCCIRNLSKKTISSYDFQISIFINYMESEFNETNITKIKKVHIKTYVLDLQETKKPTYINQLLKTVKLFYKYMVVKEYIDKNIVEGISYLKTEKTLLNTFNDQEVSRMIICYF